ncbi:putative retrovirus-related pol polyprotein from transposon [Trichonephila clavipes]|nr:putative retrovirus-related pol polyprotein from transposon [Trichonephila clavipes]
MVVDTGANVPIITKRFGFKPHNLALSGHRLPFLSIPISSTPEDYRLLNRKEVLNLIKDMTDNDAIEPSSSPLSISTILVKNKDGSTRFCVNYRRLNVVTRKDSYPLLRINDTLDTLARNTWFSTLDFKISYW